MTRSEQVKAAKKFRDNWSGHGYEKGESQKFWIDLLTSVFGVDDIANFIFFEGQVKDRIQNKIITNFIDAYIPSTHVMIEQKSSGKDLREPVRQSDGTLLTPFHQAKKYVSDLPRSQHPKWIVTCNFNEFLVYDMENPNEEPVQVLLENLDKDIYLLNFLVDSKSEKIRREEEISLKAGELVGKLYDALHNEYIPQPENQSLSDMQLRSLNILCVRIVFCLYAEDAGLFETKTCFEDYIKSFAVENLRDGIIKLFKGLDTKIDERDKYEVKLNPFPYVNGGLFRDEQIEIPNFSQEIVDVIVEHCAPFDWSEISPTIFGAVFESTLNPETRRKGGMHYTSIENIHKLIDPLFMDELNDEFKKISKGSFTLSKSEKLLAFQKKLGSLKFLDPACGSGNFLTETYLSLRRLENKVISILNKGEKFLGFDDFIKVHINQFYGIEINDFAVTVAKTALWIAESQMVAETESIISQTIDFLPLKTAANIVEGNALRMDWETLSVEQATGFLFIDKLNLYDESEFASSVEVQAPEIVDPNSLYGKHVKELNARVIKTERKSPSTEKKDSVVYDYIIGNPPFSGARMMQKESVQKKDIAEIFDGVKGSGNLDYVCCWYKKASEYMRGKKTRAALVSTNSICQGEHVPVLWKLIFGMGVQIDFAYRTFRWYAESSDMAHVHCVIVGFSHKDAEPVRLLSKKIYNSDGSFVDAKNINGYLLDMPNVFIESRQHPLCDVPEIGIGNKPIDGGFYLFGEAEMRAFIKKEPGSKAYFREWMGSDEFINGNKRWCLWLGDVPPSELLKMPECMKRVKAVREYRLKSTSAPTVKLADKPTRFHVENFPEGNYIVIPETSSENRKYIPIGFLTPDIICSNAIRIMPNAGLYHFGVLTSSVHMIWMRTVGGRLESRYRYSKDIVYNNFPWCNPTKEQKVRIERTAQAILDARSKYADCTLAQLYGENAYLFPELVEAHKENDRSVMDAYGFNDEMSESEIVSELFTMYEEIKRCRN